MVTCKIPTMNFYFLSTENNYMFIIKEFGFLKAVLKHNKQKLLQNLCFS